MVQTITNYQTKTNEADFKMQEKKKVEKMHQCLF